VKVKRGGEKLDKIQEQRLMEWYELYSGDIYRFILFMIGDQQSCEDLVHDTFVSAFYGIGRFENRSSPKTWLFGIARNLVMDEIRKRRRRRIFTAIIGEKEIPSPFNLEQYVANREDVRQLLNGIQLLKAEYRLVITLKKIEDCSTKEITEILGWSEVKVRKTLSRALAALRKSEGIEGGSRHEKSS
jgi:RNA polymerase sigma-70 factor, ECF subfamily